MPHYSPGNNANTMARQHVLSNRYHRRGWQHYMCQEFDDCLVAWRKALMIRDVSLGPRNEATQETCDLICTVLCRMGLTDKDCKQYLKILKKSVRHESYGDALAAEGGRKANKKAFREFRKALKLEETLLGKEHHMITATLHRKIASVTTDPSATATAWQSWSSEPPRSLLGGSSSSLSSSSSGSTRSSAGSDFFPSLSMTSSSLSDTSILLYCDCLASDYH